MVYIVFFVPQNKANIFWAMSKRYLFFQVGHSFQIRLKLGGRVAEPGLKDQIPKDI